MPDTNRVNQSRLAGGLVLGAMVALVGGLIGLRWISAGEPAPTSAAALPTPSQQPTDRPSATASVTPNPLPSPTPTQGATRSPTLRPIDGLAAVRILTTAEFQSVFRSGEFVGLTLVVRGRLDADIRCNGERTCSYATLAGATIATGPFSLPVRTGHIELPVAGHVLRIATADRVDYLGRAVVYPVGVWAPEQVGALDRAGLEPDEVVLVDGWLSQSTIRIHCAPLVPDELLPRHYCGEQAWISTSQTLGEGELVLGIQPDAYREFALHPRRDRLADAYVPRHGLMAIGVRLERDGCEAPPCAAWHVLGWITAQPGLSARFPTP